MAATRYVIVGGSAAGIAAAQAIRELDGAGTVTVLSAESDPPYYRPMIPFLIDGKKTVSDMALLGQGPYTAKGIDVRLGAVATRVDPLSHTVVVNGSEAISYDRLLIATGSRPSIPPTIEGASTTGVFALRTLADARAMAELAGSAREVVLAGGGMLNLKTAFALLERRLQVTMVVTSPEILSQIMDPDGATLIREALVRAGLRILTGRSVVKTLGDRVGEGESGGRGDKIHSSPTHPLSPSPTLAGVLLDTGETLPCQMLCIGKGVVPNVEFLAGSGIRLDRGVALDSFTATSAPNVYAAGDVAVTFDSITGAPMMTALWTNAVEMGRCAGRNMAGARTAYTGTFGILNATQVAEVPFVSMGIVHTGVGSPTDAGSYEVHTHRGRDSYRKIVFAGSNGAARLVGAVLVGDIEHAGLYRQMIRERMPMDRLKDLVVEQRIRYGHFLRL